LVALKYGIRGGQMGHATIVIRSAVVMLGLLSGPSSVRYGNLAIRWKCLSECVVEIGSLNTSGADTANPHQA